MISPIIFFPKNILMYSVNLFNSAEWNTLNCSVHIYNYIIKITYKLRINWNPYMTYETYGRLYFSDNDMIENNYLIYRYSYSSGKWK